MFTIDFEQFFSAIPAAFMALITVINPLGSSFILTAMTKGIDDKTRRILARKITLNTLGLFLVVLVFGKFILMFFGLNIPIIQVGGGMLLATIGWNMLNQNDSSSSEETPTTQNKSESPEHLMSKAFYPFTFPVVSGPGCIAVIFTLSAHRSKPADLITDISSLAGTYVGLIGVALVVYVCYVYSIVIEKNLGNAGSEAINRLLAFVTFCIGLQISWTGIHALIKTLQ